MTRESVRPVKVEPRLDAKPWGGRLLEAWGITLPPGETIGEALLTAPEATVTSGALSGTHLSTLASRDPAAWIGARGLEATGGRPIFPLLINSPGKRLVMLPEATHHMMLEKNRLMLFRTVQAFLDEASE